MTDRQQCERLYRDAFGDSGEFDKMLFDLFFENVVTLKKEDTVVLCILKCHVF